MVPALERWTREKVQNAAYMHFGMPVVEILTMGSYNCRTVAGTDRMSAHARAEAIDVGGFVLADGRRYTVLPKPTLIGRRPSRSIAATSSS